MKTSPVEPLPASSEHMCIMSARSRPIGVGLGFRLRCRLGLRLPVYAASIAKESEDVTEPLQDPDSHLYHSLASSERRRQVKISSKEYMCEPKLNAACNV